MKFLWVAALCFCISTPLLAQNADSEPASRDDVILYLRTMHSHDLMKRVMEAQSNAMQQMFQEQLLKEKGKVPVDFATKYKKAMDDLIKNMPVDDITQAMIPAYQKHFTKGDLEAMNAFYSSPVGQKVLEELPAVMQEGMQAAMPMMTKYLNDWQEQLKKDLGSSDSKAQ